MRKVGNSPVLRLKSALALLALVAAVVACTAAQAGTKDTTLSLVAYSIPTNVFPKLISAYQATPQGNGVKFTTSFAASEVQSKAVAAGLPTDVVNFSISTDVDRLVQAGLVDKTWDQNPYHGIVSKSVVVFVLRNGNPKHIRTWDDLVKPGVQVVFPNPFSSGGARWDVMAAYGSQLREGKKPAQARAYLTQLFQHNVSQDTSGRNALNTFLSGKGDVLIDYESDAKLAQSQGKPVYYLIPKATLQIETPLAAVNSSTGCTRLRRRTSGRRTASARWCRRSRSGT
jgi:sulfate/thiosulfate-binding protein